MSDPSSSVHAQTGVTIEQLVELVERARNGERKLSVQLFGVFLQMRTRPGVPAPEQALADVLVRILIKEPNPDLSGLPEEWAVPIRELLERLSSVSE